LAIPKSIKKKLLNTKLHIPDGNNMKSNNESIIDFEGVYGKEFASYRDQTNLRISATAQNQLRKIKNLNDQNKKHQNKKCNQNEDQIHASKRPTLKPPLMHATRPMFNGK
jgi:hypothetical protein